MAAALPCIRSMEGPGGLLKIVFPYGGQEHEVRRLYCMEQAEVVLACLQRAAAEVADPEAPSGGGGDALAQLVRELQACVRLNRLSAEADFGQTHVLMLAAAEAGHASAARQLLLHSPQVATQGEWSDCIPIHLAALRGHAALLQLFLAVAPEAVAVTCHHFDGDEEEWNEWSLMHSAAHSGSVATIEALLALAPQLACRTNEGGKVPLHVACKQGHAGAVRCLLAAAPATAAVQDSDGFLPVHWAAGKSAEVVQLLLDAAGPSQLLVATNHGHLPLHLAASVNNADTIELLLAAAPQAAAVENAHGVRPLHESLLYLRRHSTAAGYSASCLDAASALLPASGLGPSQLLRALAEAGPAADSLYADLATLFPLSAAQWQQVPQPLNGLGRALPAVLARSESEAGQLVRHMPAAAGQRLRTAALCLARAQRGPLGVPLPEPLARRILALSMDDA